MHDGPHTALHLLQLVLVMGIASHLLALCR